MPKKHPKDKAKTVAAVSKITIPDTIIHLAIENVKKKHYLGSANHKTGDPTGGLSGYYRNISEKATRGTLTFSSRETVERDIVMLQAISLSYLGMGNCGELATAFYIELLSMDLTPEQKKLISLYQYTTKNSHMDNSYVLIDKQVYDLWSNKSYPRANLVAETGVKEKKHALLLNKDTITFFSTHSQETFGRLKQTYQLALAARIDQELNADRKKHAMYVTLSTDDLSDQAILAQQAFPYLFEKFGETIQDAYFIAHPIEAVLIRQKIIKDYIFLLEEMREDYPASIHPARVKYDDVTINATMASLIPDKTFIRFILAMSYQHFNPARTIEELTALRSSLIDPKSDVDKTLLTHINLQLKRLSSKPESTATAASISDYNRTGFFSKGTPATGAGGSLSDDMDGPSASAGFS